MKQKLPLYNNEGLRRCRGWRHIEPHYTNVNNFSKLNKAKDGLHQQCKECGKAYNAWSNPKHNPTTNSNPKYDETRRIASDRTRQLQLETEDRNLGCYIYYHYDNDEVVYIGRGRGDRAWSFNRQVDHLTWLVEQAKSSKQWVTLRKYYLTEEEAEWLEAIKINLYKPRFNIQIPSLENLRKKYNETNLRYRNGRTTQ